MSCVFRIELSWSISNEAPNNCKNHTQLNPWNNLLFKCSTLRTLSFIHLSLPKKNPYTEFVNFNLVDQKNSHNCIIIVKGVKFIQIDSNLIKTLNSKKWPKPKKSSLHIKMHLKIHLSGFSAPSQSKWEKMLFGYGHRNSIDSGNMMHVSTRSVHLFMFFHSFCMRFVMPNENLACNRDYDAIKCRLFVVKRANAMELHRPTATMQKITAIFAYNVCVNSLYFSIYVLLGSIGYVLCVRWAWRRHGSWNHRSQLTVIERKIGVCSSFSNRSTFDDWMTEDISGFPLYFHQLNHTFSFLHVYRNGWQTPNDELMKYDTLDKDSVIHWILAIRQRGLDSGQNAFNAPRILVSSIQFNNSKEIAFECIWDLAHLTRCTLHCQHQPNSIKSRVCVCARQFDGFCLRFFFQHGFFVDISVCGGVS